MLLEHWVKFHFSIGWGTSVEMIGSVRIPTLLALSLVAGGVTPPIGITGNIDSTFIGFNPFDTYHVTATQLEKSSILSHMWFQEMVCFDYILDTYAQFCA